MKNPISKIILPIVLLIALSLPVEAQTQYEYAVVTYVTSQRYMTISIKGDVYKEINVDKSESKGSYDVNPVIKEITKMNMDGWEVFEANSIATAIHIFHLRREKE